MGIYYQTITSGNLGITMKFEGYGGIDGDVELETYHDNKWGFM